MSHTSPAPTIRLFGSHPPPYHGSTRATHLTSPLSSQQSSSARPMAIPNAREDPPPPLPPPRDIYLQDQSQDLGWKYGNSNGNGSYGSVKEGSSLYGAGQGFQGEHYDRASRDQRRGSSMSHTMPIDPAMMDNQEPSDDDRNSRTRPTLAGFRFQSENQLGQKALHSSSQAYDKQLLSKIGGPNTKNGTLNFANQLKPLSMPDHRFGSMDSPLGRWQSAPNSAVSPGLRSPGFDSGSADAFPTRWNPGPGTPDDSTSGYRSHRNSDDHGVFLDPELGSMEENGIRDLNIHDRTPSGGDGDQLGIKSVGVKRRASSPPSDGPLREDRVPGSGNDLYHRRSMQMLANRNSPVTRPNQQPGSLSSNASLGPRSFNSSWNLSVASSATSYGERHMERSPGISPSADADFGPVSPYAASRALDLNRSPLSAATKSLPHHRKPSLQDSKMTSPLDSQIHSRQNSVSKIQGFFVCECCPKKPKKFENADELRIHEMEKQYQCAYCLNRFKNKNEAERHQNSLHLRRHSWSCAALGGVLAAFHESSIHPTTADVCGYCGDEFPNPPNWDARAEHLSTVHKYGECNQAKKFYRADHFRQHLKHSHAGTSGKWTNMLEHACMKEELTPAALPPRQLVPAPMGSSGHLINPSPGHFMGNASGPYPGIINEVHEES